jgi:hypothetical protein
MKKRLIILFLMGLPATSYAWAPCVPFCDAGCGGAAIQAMGTSISVAMQNQSSANQQLLQTINDTTQSTVSLGTDLVDSWTTSTMDILSALDARTSKIELAQTTQIKGREYSTDALTKVFTQALREKYLAEKVSENNRIFSETAMPETGEIGANAATPIKEAYFKLHQHAEEVATIQKQFAEEITPGDSSFAVNARLTSSDDVYKGHLLVCEKTLSNDELNQIQTLVTYISNPKPLPVLGNAELSSSGGQKYELKRRVYNAKSQMVSAIVNEVVAHRAQFASPDIVRSYVSRSSSEPELSLNEAFDSLIVGRVSSDGWYLNIKILNEVGLQREMTYLKAEENVLLYMLSQRREWRNQLLAAIAIEELGQLGGRMKESAM